MMLCELEQHGPVAGIESEGDAEALQELGRYLDIASLFEPCVPGGADAHELRDFLPTQTGSASSHTGSEPYILRLGSAPTLAQEQHEVLSCFEALQACHAVSPPGR